MDTKELRKLSKSELARRLKEEYEKRVALEKRLEDIERKLRYFENPHTPSSKRGPKKAKQHDCSQNKEDLTPENGRFPGKPRRSAGGGVKLPPADRQEEYRLDHEPHTGEPLGAPIGHRKKRVMDMPKKPIQVTEYIIYRYRSPTTGDIIEPGISLPASIYGPNLKSFTAMLRYISNSCEKVGEIIRNMGAQSMCPATVNGMCSEFIDPLTVKCNEISDEIEKAKYAHMDETGMRRDGKNGYVWVLCSHLSTVFLAAGGRGREYARKLLRNFKGILITDGYGVYDFYPYRQRCWAHMIREFKEYAEMDHEVMSQYYRMKKLYESLKEINKEPPDKHMIGWAKYWFHDIVQCLSTIRSARKLVKLLRRAGDEWFTALYYEGVPLDNNRAERELRQLVLFRKITGGYRTWKGKRWIEVVVSVLHTWRAQGKNLFEELRKVAKERNPTPD